MMLAQLVIFDMVGTTVSDGGAVTQCLNAALEVAGLDASGGALRALTAITTPRAIRLLVEQTPENAAVRADSDYDADPRIARIHADFYGRLLAWYQTSPDVREIPGSAATFRALQDEGVKVALDTGSPRPLADALLARLGWMNAGLIDAVVAIDEVPLGRPAPDALFQAMEITRVAEARQVARVGTSPIDLRQGAAAGCGYVVGIIGAGRENAELADSYHTHLVPTIAAVPAFLREQR